MNFDEYIKKLSLMFNVAKIDDDTYTIDDGKNIIKLSRDDPINESSVLSFFNIDHVNIGDDDLYPDFAQRNILESKDSGIKGAFASPEMFKKKYMYDNSGSGSAFGTDPFSTAGSSAFFKKDFAREREDDPMNPFMDGSSHPSNRQKDGRDISDDESEKNPFMKTEPTSPFKGRKGPDPDHLKKPGNNNDKDGFMY